MMLAISPTDATQTLLNFQRYITAWLIHSW